MIRRGQTRQWWWEKKIGDLDKALDDAPTFRRLVAQKQLLADLEANRGRDMSAQACAANVARLRKDIDELEATLKREAEELSDDDEDEAA